MNPTIVSNVTIAVREMYTYKDKDGAHISYGDVIKFVDSVAEAEELIKKRKGDIFYSRKEYGYERWTMAQFAEYVRQQFEEIENRFDSHRL